MKKINRIILGTVFLATIALTISCKKTGDPGPAGTNGTNGINGTNGTNGTALAYKQTGTTLQLTGIYSSDGAAFDNTYPLSFYATLDENSIVEETVTINNNPVLRVEETTTDYYYHIVRRDSLNNSVLSFDIAFYDGDTEPTVENLNIDIITNVASTGYKRISTGYVYNPSVSARTTSGTAEGYFNRGYLNSSQISNNTSLAISDWDYNATTKKLSFKFSGTISDYYNSTKNDLLVNATVVANLSEETHRIGKE